MKVQIKHRYSDAVIFECEAPDDLESGLHTRFALEKATQARAYLAGAYLARANLDGANLDRAYLDGAYLAGAYLAGANLDGANLAGAKLIGERPVFQIGPIGSRCAYFVAYLTDQGIKLRAGCFFGSVAEFREQLAEEHGGNQHGQEYEAALVLIEKHAELWAPVAQEVAA